jgi:hypothetical protein
LTYGGGAYLSREHLKEFYAEDRPIVRLADLVHQGVDLLARYKECTQLSFQADLFNVRSLLLQLRELDIALAKWAARNELDAYYLKIF